MNISIENTYIGLARELQNNISDPARAHYLSDHSKDRKCASKRKWNSSEYYLQEIKDVSHILVKMSCATTQFPKFSFCGPHAKPHGVRGINKNYNLRLDPKLDHVKCAIQQIPCSFIACTTMLDKPWPYKVDPNKNPCYQHVVDCTY